jgi:hypothetical protein
MSRSTVATHLFLTSDGRRDKLMLLFAAAQALVPRAQGLLSRQGHGALCSLVWEGVGYDPVCVITIACCA